MSSGGVAYATGRLGTPDLTRFKNLIPEAVTRAIYKTKEEVLELARQKQIVPFLTGLLQSSIVAFISPGQITFQWSAMDKGYDYAKIQDEGGVSGRGGVITGKHFSTFLLQAAKYLLIDNLTAELQAVAP